MTTIERVNDRPALLGECPVWSVVEQVLYWVDIDGMVVHRLDPSIGVAEERAIAGRPGALALTATAGRLLVAVEHELLWLDWDSGDTTRFLALEAPGTGNRLNDGRCDPAGRFVIGSMFSDTSAGRRRGILHQVEPDGSRSIVRTGIGVSNGLAFDPTRERAYFADTHTDSIIMWDYDTDTGRRSNERLFVDYHDIPGRPDGGCVDAEGCYWSASVYGWAVTRFTPDGVVDRRIELPVEKPSMPAFGGPDLSTLFVTSIGSGAGGRDGFEGGSLLAIDAGVTGVAEPVFAAG